MPLPKIEQNGTNIAQFIWHSRTSTKKQQLWVDTGFPAFS